ncbi:MAG: hypothetical protein A2806_00770 [Candidatus Terrybacteria bacterium RIFCSPHIGHO2_01_FULL_48_17]|uniref:Uncharacterized protein n=1 Tax=Candidatus Terrybacteria bacterium RIFCSPHIGHO2_01_FULL_48_17 TaxID=1802362 RepID=A0A1G2PIJ6_9BACT|nr:MAG: hypothetical protein A2806_00770 [Candidatus Terrybacteria bacterium RIFCSPHIGHO2_01_FULL_48_17]OHA53870.1 MAG: hypothetical protein A3A30_01370 [Candidatus Terrybacteria bacterium RIFCSPLOWO2_01_FULL_48_14]
MIRVILLIFLSIIYLLSIPLPGLADFHDVATPQTPQNLEEGGEQVFGAIDIIKKIWYFVASIVVIILEAANRVMEAFQNAFGQGIISQDPQGFIPERINDTIDKRLPQSPQE